MHKLTLRLDDQGYDIITGPEILKHLDEYFPAPDFAGAKVLLVTDEHTSALYGARALKGLSACGYLTAEVVLPPGEAHKNAESLHKIYEAAFRFGLGRQDKIAALGGGVVGDLAGFAAATYMRGIDYIQLPSSLLAQVDASVGGKTGIDTAFGKNLIGAFKQPSLVLADTSLLETLPFRELASGMAEVIKYGLLAGEGLFSEIESLPAACPPEDLIAVCIAQKAKIVKQDEKEEGLRAVLNLGHSFGHAIEKASGYQRYTHGEAVALGLLAALRLGELQAFTPKSILPRVQNLLQRWSLPTSTDLRLDEILPQLTADKKRQGEGLHFVLLREIGEPMLHWMSDELMGELAESLKGYCLEVPASHPEKLKIYPGRISGEVYPPPSKSEAHRFLICAALAELESGGDFRAHLLNYGEAKSQDIEATAEDMALLTEAWRENKEATLDLDCRESGSTLRFLIPVAAALGLNVRFTGRGRLPKRPLDAYRKTLGEHGVVLDFPEEKGQYLPLEISGKLQPAAYEIEGDSSSQFITGMLIAMCLLDGPSSLQLTTKLESAPYVDMTLDCLRRFGQDISESWQQGQLRYDVRPVGGFRRPKRYLEIERDYSQAAFWYLAAFTGQDIRLKGLNENSLQGDRVIGNILETMQDRRERKSFGAAVEFDVSQFPDLFPCLAIAAALCGKGRKTRLVNAARLRIKESDRLQTSADLLKAFGVPHTIGDDYLEIEGVNALDAAALDSAGDHRIAMAAAIAALQADGPCIIKGVGAVDKSYPAFWRELRRLGAKIEEA